MSRTLENKPARAIPVEPPEPGKVQAWLAEQARANHLTYLLAYADDGVIWGRWTESEGLLTAHEAAAQQPQAKAVCPELRGITLQQARLFGSTGEILLWRNGSSGQLQARLLCDTPAAEGDWQESYDERQRLIGTHGTPLLNNFTLLEDGAQGLRHAIPAALFPPSGASQPRDAMPIDPTAPPCLVVRHYLGSEAVARVAVSRLVALEWKGASNVPA